MFSSLFKTAGEVSAHAPTYAYVGCYRDTAINRAFPNHQPGVHGSDQCFRLATEKKLHFYGLQNGGECWLDERNRNHYNKHGESGACMGHDGGPWANSVYKINCKYLSGLLSNGGRNGKQMISHCKKV